MNIISDYKTNKYVQDCTNDIFKDSIGSKMYELGVAIGMFQMTKLLKSDKETIRILSQSSGSIWEHFRKLVESDYEELTDVEKISEQWEEMIR